MRSLLGLVVIIFLFGCSKENQDKSESASFVPPEDGKITKEMAQAYVNASNNLMKAIFRHEKDMEGFSRRYKLSSDLSELSDSVYREEHPDVIKAWERLQSRWQEYEKDAYKKAGISEEEFNWIGGALADTVNAEIQLWIQEQLRKLYKE